MDKRGRRRYRGKVVLSVEPLEDRVAPTVLTNGQSLNFTDQDGDAIEVQFFGPGQATIIDTNGNDPGTGPNADIGNIWFERTAAMSRMAVFDTNPGVGGDTLSAGLVEFVNGSKSLMGELFLDAVAGVGTVQNTQMPYGQLRSLTVFGATVSSCVFKFANPNVRDIYIEANMTNASMVCASCDVKQLYINGGLQSSTAYVGRDVQLLMLIGPITNNSYVQVIRNVRTMQQAGGIFDSRVKIGKNAGDVWLMGGVYNTGADTCVEIGGNVRTLNIIGDVDGSGGGASEVLVHGHATGVVVFGMMLNNGRMEIGGKVKDMTVVGDVDGASMTIHGRASEFRVVGHVTNAASIVLFGGCSTFTVEGDYVDSTFCLVGNARTLRFMGDVLGSSLTVNSRVLQVFVEARFINTNLDVHGNLGLAWFGEQFGDTALGHSELWVGGNTRLLQIGGPIFGDGNPNTNEVEIEGTLGRMILDAPVLGAMVRVTNLRTALIGGDVINSALSVLRTAREILVTGNVDASLMLVTDTLNRCTVMGSVRNNSYIGSSRRVNHLTVGNDLENSVFQSAGPVLNVNIGGSIEGSAYIDIGDGLRELNVGADIGAPGGPPQPTIQVRAIKQATVGGLVYGNLRVMGKLGDIYSAGTDATPIPPGLVPLPFRGGFDFNDEFGTPTGGKVYYVTWAGKTVK